MTEQQNYGELELVVLPATPDGPAPNVVKVYLGEEAGPFGSEDSLTYEYVNRGPYRLEIFSFTTNEVLATPGPGESGAISDAGEIGGRITG